MSVDFNPLIAKDGHIRHLIGPVCGHYNAFHIQNRQKRHQTLLQNVY